MQAPSPRFVGSLALLGALAFCAWLWSAPWRSGGFSDGQHALPVDTALRYATWGAPEAALWSGLPKHIDGRVALSPDGHWMVWASQADAASTTSAHDLFVAELRNGQLGQAAPLTSLNSERDDCSPAFGGEWLYFSSDREAGQGGHDLWRARFSEGVALAPEPVPGPANSAGDELDPAPLINGEEIVFVADRDGASLDLYSAPLRAGESTRLNELCSPAEEREPLLTQADRALVFASKRAGGQGGLDLYRAARFDGHFGPIEALTPLNSADDERAPLAEMDDLALAFVRAPAEGDAHVLRSPAIELFRARGRPIHWTEWLALIGLCVLALLALLVRRFPELDLIYKCALVSVIVHLLLLWWFHDVWLHGGERDREHLREPIRVRLADREPATVAALTPIPPPRLEPVLELQPAQPQARLERADVALARPNDSVEQPRNEPLSARASDEAPSRSSDNAVVPARSRSHAAVPREVAQPAPTPAASAAELGLTALPSESAVKTAASAPKRHQSKTPRDSMPTSMMEPVANAASPSRELARREANTVEPARSSEAALAVRESASDSLAAGPVPALLLNSLASSQPSATSRPLGSPSRPARSRSLGSPAASTSSSSVAKAAAMTAPASRISSVDAGALAAERSDTRDVPLAVAEGSAPAQSAAPASALELAALSAAEVASEQASGVEAGPQRSTSSVQRRTLAAQPTARGGSLARKAAQADDGVSSPARRAELSPSSGASAARLANEVEQDAGDEVALQASLPPALGLGSAPAEVEDLGTADEPATSGPARAKGAAAGQNPARPSAALGGSLASRASAPAPGLPKASSTQAGAEPARGERAVELADATGFAAQPAESAPADGGRGWLSELAPKASAAGGESAPNALGPERIEGEQLGRPAQPLAGDGALLARAERLENADEQRPAKSAWDSTPYQNRSGNEKARALKLYGGSERTETAVAKGLAYLARIQGKNGAWGDLGVVDEKYGRVAVGKSALCTLAFLGAGHTPDSATEHSALVARAIAFLLAVQDPDSGHFGETSAYDHGIATYAIAECFALTHDQRLRAALERAIEHVLAMQSRRDDERFRGGWGYYFADGSHYDPWPRTSITAWQVMALESARLSGLEVPDRAFDEARVFLVHAHDPKLGAYRYNHEPERLSSAYPTLPASTPAALFALALLGEDISSAAHEVSREYVLARAPNGFRYSGERDFVLRAQGNPYFWYYGTLAMFRVGGAQWQRWNTTLQESLLPAQSKDGSWQPIDAYSKYAHDSAADKSYTTALCVLSLEIYYRYYLPLLKLR